MQATSYPEVNTILDILLLRIQAIMGEKLVGLYLYGSLVIGDFDPVCSDVDLVAALSAELDEGEFEALQKMHADFANEHREWDDRIEVCYISVAALNTVRSRTSTIANISPGEPFHRRETSREWLADWFIVREKSKTLFGPSPRTLIEPISKDEFVQAIQAHARGWREWVQHMHDRKSQAYAILTLCRALYTCKNGEQVSKRQAAFWAQQELPAWSYLIGDALLWRETRYDEQVDHTATFAETQRFVNFVVDRIIPVAK